MQSTQQIVLWQDWQAIFPSNWQRVRNRELNQACEQIEAVYAIDCQPSTLFAQNGDSLFFSNLSYEQTTQRIFHADTGQQNECFLFKQGQGKADRGVYQLDGARVETLSDFIGQFHLSTGRLPEWKRTVWQQLEKLREHILHRPMPER